jgi:PKHD-type hydroxylase
LENVFAQQVAKANKECGWEYHLTGSERVQFAEYGQDNHYTWHTDTFTLSGKPEDRKITVVCLLNDEFQGGDFEVRLYNDYNAGLKKGTIIAFPSILEHRVLPVVSGTRYSATMWFNGPRFR